MWSWDDFQRYSTRLHAIDPARTLFERCLEQVLTRRNTVNGRAPARHAARAGAILAAPPTTGRDGARPSSRPTPDHSLDDATRAATLELLRMAQTFATSLALAAALVLVTPPRAADARSRDGAQPDVRTLTVPYPDDPSRHVEYFEARPAGTGPWPTMVFLHGQQDAPSPGGRVFVDTGVLKELAQRGFLAVGVSLPGFGGSSGPDDFAGPLAVRGVEVVLGALRRSGLAASGRIALEGVSLGAMTAGFVAAGDSTLAGAVLVSGEYDLPDVLVHPRSLTAWTLIARAAVRVGGREGLRDRSLLLAAPRIRVPLLLLSGDKDDRTDPAHARRLAAAITAGHGHARFVLVPGYGHRIPPAVRTPIVEPFLDSVLVRR